MNRNFPRNLAILPSVPPRSAGTAHHVDCSGLEDEPEFSAAAQQEAIKKYGIAGRVWEAAYALDLYVRSPPNLEFDPPFGSVWWAPHPYTVIELGSGTGMVGSRIADKVAHRDKDLVVVTDLPEVCPLLNANLSHRVKHQFHGADEAGGAVILVRPLTWGSSEHALRLASELRFSDGRNSRVLTHIVCSDLVYFPELFAPLLRTLIQLSSPPFVSLLKSSCLEHGPVVVVIAYKIRSLTKESSFWSAFGLWFSFEPVLMRSTSPGDYSHNPTWTRVGSGSSSDEPTFVFVARRRQASFTWIVPQSDQELMDGVGAYATDTRKGDDTFETLLLMTIQA